MAVVKLALAAAGFFWVVLAANGAPLEIVLILVSTLLACILGHLVTKRYSDGVFVSWWFAAVTAIPVFLSFTFLKKHSLTSADFLFTPILCLYFAAPVAVSFSLAGGDYFRKFRKGLLNRKTADAEPPGLLPFLKKHRMVLLSVFLLSVANLAGSLRSEEHEIIIAQYRKGLILQPSLALSFRIAFFPSVSLQVASLVLVTGAFCAGLLSLRGGSRLSRATSILLTVLAALLFITESAVY